MKKQLKKEENISSIISSQALNFGLLGREIKVSPKSNISINKPGYKIEFMEETVDVLIGIGKDNTAHLVMSKRAWEALKSGEQIDITTNKEFKNNFL